MECLTTQPLPIMQRIMIPSLGVQQRIGVTGECVISTSVHNNGVYLLCIASVVTVVSCPQLCSQLVMQACQRNGSTHFPNAVESHNRLSKKQHPEILKVAMQTDMALLTVEHIAQCKGISTRYAATQNTRQKRKHHLDDDNGPPDKQRHFDKGMQVSSKLDTMCLIKVLLLYVTI